MSINTQRLKAWEDENILNDNQKSMFEYALKEDGHTRKSLDGLTELFLQAYLRRILKRLGSPRYFDLFYPV